MNESYKRQLDDCNDELSELKERIDKDQLDSMVKFLQRYAIIKACGTIEAVFKSILADKVEQGVSTEVQKYLDKNIRDSSSNPSTKQIERILEQFSNEWKIAFQDAVKQNHSQDKENLNSLVQLRNDFAHGSSPNASINTIIKQFESGRIIIELLDSIIS